MMAVEKNVFVEMESEGCRDGGNGFEGWWEERSLPQKVMLGILFAVGGISLMALFGGFVMLLWNWLMPDIFGLGTVNYWQAWGLMILSWILFKGFHAGDSSGSTERKRKKELRRYIREDDEADSSPDTE
jgi:hypothetical protein